MPTMTAAVLHGREDLRVEKVPVPEPKAGEVLLEVRAVGVCGTDAAEYHVGPSMFPVHRRHPTTGHLGPMVIGHEFSGEVVETGPGVEQAWAGRLVASCGAITCGDCRQCRAGRTNMCMSYGAIGLHRHGAAARYVATPVDNCEPADELGLSPDAAALGQPMSIAVHAARRGRVAAGERVVLLGAGGIGAFLSYVLAEMNCHTAVADPDEARRELAARLGAAVTAHQDDVDGIIHALGGQPDVIVEASGTAGGLDAACDMLPPGGRLVVVGLQHNPVTIDLRSSTLREHEIIGTNAMVRDLDFTDALRLVASREQGWHDVAPVALGLDQLVSDGLVPMAAGRSPAVKVLVDPQATWPRRTRTVPNRTQR